MLGIMSEGAGRLIPAPPRRLADPMIVPPPEECGCPWQGKYAFNARLDVLYPKLTAGNYTLKIYFSPRSATLSDIDVEFPQLSLVFADIARAAR
jgi:hypothetical protein